MIMEELMGKNPALLVIDCQRKFYSDRPDMEEAQCRAVFAIDRLLHAFRAAGRPVIFVEFEGEAYCKVYEGDDGDQLFPGLYKRPGEITVPKRHMNSFKESDLEKVIKGTGSDSVVICGTVTQFCVMQTYFSAMDRDIVPYLGHKATLSNLDEIVDAAEVVCKTFKEETVYGILGVEMPPKDVNPVLVANTYPEWDDSMVYDAVALANAGGGHFIVGYPNGLKDREAVAEHIRNKLAQVPGLVASAETLKFCMMDAVDVVAEKAAEPIEYEGQVFTAVRNYSY